MHNTSVLIAGIPFLKGGPPGFVYRLAQVLKAEAFITGDDIMITGEIGNEMSQTPPPPAPPHGVRDAACPISTG